MLLERAVTYTLTSETPVRFLFYENRQIIPGVSEFQFRNMNNQ